MVMDKGVVVAEGTHESLMRDEAGIYHKVPQGQSVLSFPRELLACCPAQRVPHRCRQGRFVRLLQLVSHQITGLHD